jgi:hypothetical protein
MDDPTTFLVAPGEPDASVTRGFVNPLDMFNYISPSAWINAAIQELTGVDVLEWIAEWLSGEWDAIWKFGDAMGNLAECLQQLGFNIQRGVVDLDLTWDGNASDAAYQYFSSLATALSDQHLPLQNIGEDYHKAALGAWELADQLGNIMQAIADRVIIAGIAAAAGTITAETGVGAAVGYGVSALVVADILTLINKASTIINTGAGAIVTLLGIGMDTAYKGGALSTIPLPSVAYSFPGA